MSPTKLFHHRSGPIEATSMASMLILLVIATVLLANLTQAVEIGECWDDYACGEFGGQATSTVSGDPKPNNEVFIKTTCKSFRSHLQMQYKADVCSNKKCERLRHDVCFDGGPWKSIEFVE